MVETETRGVVARDPREGGGESLLSGRSGGVSFSNNSLMNELSVLLGLRCHPRTFSSCSARASLVMVTCLVAVRGLQ